MKNVGIDQRGKQVVRRGYGVEVAVKMQIDLLAGLDLRFSSAGGTAFHAENRPQRRLARRDDRPSADALQPLRKSDGRNGLPFTGCSGRGGGHQDKLASARECRVRKDIQL